MRRLLTCLAASAIVALAGRVQADEADICANEAEAGQIARAQGKLRAAREHVIACARPSCPRVVRSDCARWLDEIEAEVPSIVVRAREGGSDVAEVVVFVDGTKTVERVDGKPIPLDAGEHELRFERAGAAPVTQRLVVRTGERSRLVSVQFGGEGATGGSRVGPLVLGGVGLGFVAGGGALWAIGSGEHGDLESTCAPAGACASTDIDASRTKLILGDVAMAVGVLALAGAAYWYFSSRTTGAQARATTAIRF